MRYQQLKYQKNYLISNTNISKTLSHNIISNTIFWNCFVRPFRYIHANCFHIIKFFAKVSSQLRKRHFFWQFKDNNSGRKHGSYANDPIFHLLLLLYLFVTFISEFENTQYSFSCGPPFVPFWSVKYLYFSPKTTDSGRLSYFSRR